MENTPLKSKFHVNCTFVTESGFSIRMSSICPTSRLRANASNHPNSCCPNVDRYCYRVANLTDEHHTLHIGVNSLVIGLLIRRRF